MSALRLERIKEEEDESLSDWSDSSLLAAFKMEVKKDVDSKPQSMDQQDKNPDQFLAHSRQIGLETFTTADHTGAARHVEHSDPNPLLSGKYGFVKCLLCKTIMVKDRLIAARHLRQVHKREQDPSTSDVFAKANIQSLAKLDMLARTKHKMANFQSRQEAASAALPNCHLCGASLIPKSNLVRHYKTVHKFSKGEIPSNVLTAPSNRTLSQCPGCRGYFSRVPMHKAGCTAVRLAAEVAEVEARREAKTHDDKISTEKSTKRALDPFAISKRAKALRMHASQNRRKHLEVFQGEDDRSDVGQEELFRRREELVVELERLDKQLRSEPKINEKQSAPMPGDRKVPSRSRAKKTDSPTSDREISPSHRPLSSHGRHKLSRAQRSRLISIVPKPEKEGCYNVDIDAWKAMLGDPESDLSLLVREVMTSTGMGGAKARLTLRESYRAFYRKASKG